MPRLTDYDRRAKVSNIQTKTTLTVSQFGTVREPNPDKIQIVAGERLDGNDYIMVPYLWFREWGSRRCLRLNATNIAFLTERGYTDVQALIGCTLTLEVVEEVNYGKRQPMVLITSIKPPQGKADPTPYRTERLAQLKTHTSITAHRILSPACLPIPPLRPVKFNEYCFSYMSKEF